MDVSQVSAGPETRRRKVAALRPLFEQLAALNDPEQLEQLLRDREQRGAGPRARLRGAVWAAGKSGAVLDQLHEQLAAANRQARFEGNQTETSFKQALENARDTQRPEAAESALPPRDGAAPRREAPEAEIPPDAKNTKTDVPATSDTPAKAQAEVSQPNPDAEAEPPVEVKAAQGAAAAKPSSLEPGVTAATSVGTAKDSPPQTVSGKQSHGAADGGAKPGRPTSNAGQSSAQAGQSSGEPRTQQPSDAAQKAPAGSANPEGKPRDASSSKPGTPPAPTPAAGDAGTSSKPATAGSNAQVEAAAEQGELVQATGAPAVANTPAAPNSTPQTTTQAQTPAGTVKVVAKPTPAMPAARVAVSQANARAAQPTATNAAPAEQASHAAPESRARAEAGRNVSKLESTARNFDRLGKNDANIERILRFVVRSRGGETSEATMRLDPPELGRIRVRMVWQGGNLSLELEAQNEMAQRLLRQDLDGLRRGLQQAGIQLDRAEVRSAAAHESSPASQDATAQDSSFGRQSAHSADSERRGVPQGREADAGGGDQDDPGHAEDPSRGGTVGLVTESLVNVIA